MGNISFVKLDAYQAPSAIEKIHNNKKWVNYGEDNDFLEELLSIYYGSPTHSAIINGIAEMIVGGGLTSPLASRRPESYAKMVSLFRPDDVRRWAFDLKYAGYFLIQVLQQPGGGVTTSHTPVENWRSGVCDDKGEINEWYYSDNWADSNRVQYKPEPFPAYYKGAKDKISILAVKPFRAGTFYYPAVDYMGALEYARLEKEIATFHLNNVLNGLQPGMLINFNNGDPGQEERNKIEAKIKQKWGGAENAGRFILAFNDDKEKAATIETAPISDLDKQYQFLSTESSLKIMIAHRVTSPLIFGIRAEGGLGNNANELTEAYKLFSATVLDSFRRVMTDAFEMLLNDLDAPLPLVFKDNDFWKAKPTELSSHNHDLSEEQEQAWLNHLDALGEIIDPDEWQLVLSEPVDTINTAIDLENLDSDPHLKSKQDQGLYKIRYAYSPGAVQEDSRRFCKLMVERRTKGQVYRKEDIVRMGDDGVNKELSAKGEDHYSIWLYKGGVNCHHYWERRIYFRRRDPSGKFLPASETDDLANDKITSATQAKRNGVDLPVNPIEVARRPIDMPNQGRKN